MSEANMAVAASRKASGEYLDILPTYEPTFLEALLPALPDIAKYGIKVAVNAGNCMLPCCCSFSSYIEIPMHLNSLSGQSTQRATRNINDEQNGLMFMNR